MPLGKPSKRGDRRLDPVNGYWIVCVKGHPLFANFAHVWVAEHRVVMAEKLGRPLKKAELVHHRDENKLNNDPDNLELTTRGGHAALHSTGRRHTAEAITKISRCARERNATPAFNKMLRERAKAQHAAGNLGRATWPKKGKSEARGVVGRGA
jgi:hypothetical protein